MTPELPAAWTLAASAFNWTPDVIRAEVAAPEIAVGIVADGDRARSSSSSRVSCGGRSPSPRMPRSTRCAAISTPPVAA